jgi:hypothetical protein
MEILKELEVLIPPLTSDEFKQLERNILEEGIRDPLVTWNGILVDGHNRYRIAKEHNLKYKIIEINFADIDEAKDWMDRNQIGRRNLSPDMMSYIRGRMYNRSKKPAHRPKQDEKGGQNDPLKTAERIAQQTGVSEKTVKRDEQYFKAVEKVAQQLETPAVQLIYKNIATKKDATKLAKIADEAPQILDNVVERIINDKFNDKNVARDVINEFERKEVQELNMPRVCPYDSNLYYESSEQSEARYGDKVFSLKDEKYNTVSTLSRFFHSETGLFFIIL